MSDIPSFGDRYEVVRLVSEGDRAAVFHAVDRVHGRTVALKAHPVRDGDRHDLLAEAQVLMSLTPHPGLPVVSGDFFTDDGRHYVLVIKWVDGTDLQQVLDDEGPEAFTFDDVVDVAERLARAIDHLHAHEPPVVHGDVKPANVVRTAIGEIVLVDFDIASAQGGGRGRVGTAGYVAPEVAGGDKPGPASDVYGLAATVTALLTGAPPAGNEPDLSRLDPAIGSKVVRTLRQALATDPELRHRSCARFATALRESARPTLPSGVVALLATKVADSGRLWDEDADEMRTALSRLRDLRDEVVEIRGGHVVTSMNEADRTLIVFENISSAALAALDLHDRTRNARFPAGFELHQRAALAVGEVALSGGVYTGAVVDQVLRIRGAAGLDTTLASEATAEMLIGLVGDEVSIVPVGAASGAELPVDAQLFAVTRSGREHEAHLRAPATDDPSTRITTGNLVPPSVVIDRAAIVRTVSQATPVLTALTVAGLALIYRGVLAAELGGARAAVGLAAAAGVVAVIVGVRDYRSRSTAIRDQIDAAAHDRAVRERMHTAERERDDARRRLSDGFGRLTGSDAERARRVLGDLSDEFDLVRTSMERSDHRWSSGAAMQISNLVEDTYRHGMSALSDALELMEASSGRRHERLAEELAAIDERLARADLEEAERARDVQRRASTERLLGRLHASTERGRELTFEGERCTAAIAEARIELAATRIDDTQAVVDTVVESLEQTIRRVRRIQDEVRRLER